MDTGYGVSTEVTFLWIGYGSLIVGILGAIYSVRLFLRESKDHDRREPSGVAFAFRVRGIAATVILLITGAYFVLRHWKN
jgi:4-hydroxybenzoate polyprenyltransferase